MLLYCLLWRAIALLFLLKHYTYLFLALRRYVDGGYPGVFRAFDGLFIGCLGSCCCRAHYRRTVCFREKLRRWYKK